MEPPKHPDDELLAGLALDEVDVPPTTLHHVESCPRCRGAVDELRRIRQVTSAGGPRPTLDAPNAAVWSSVRDRLAGSRDEAAHLAQNTEPRRRRAAAAVALTATCLVIGVAVGRLSAPDTEQPPAADPVVEVATAELDTLTGGSRLGTATVAQTGQRTDLMLSLDSLNPGDGYLEVWLLHRDLDEMVSVGIVGDSWWPSFTIPRRLLDDGYVVVDVSRESYDGDPTHSGDSLMRGTLALDDPRAATR